MCKGARKEEKRKDGGSWKENKSKAQRGERRLYVCVESNKDDANVPIRLHPSKNLQYCVHHIQHQTQVQATCVLVITILKQVTAHPLGNPSNQKRPPPPAASSFDSNLTCLLLLYQPHSCHVCLSIFPWYSADYQTPNQHETKQRLADRPPIILNIHFNR